jgi:hypothetical protein
VKIVCPPPNSRTYCYVSTGKVEVFTCIDNSIVQPAHRSHNKSRGVYTVELLDGLLILIIVYWVVFVLWLKLFHMKSDWFLFCFLLLFWFVDIIWLTFTFSGLFVVNFSFSFSVVYFIYFLFG